MLLLYFGSQEKIWSAEELTTEKSEEMKLVDWGSWGAIVASIIAIIGLIYAGVRWLRHKIKFKSPINASYLIPKAEYPLGRFKGAPPAERRQNKLTVGIGQYQIFHVLSVRTNVTVDNYSLGFSGPDKNKPTIDTPNNPFIVDTFTQAGVTYRKDWWGNIHPYAGNNNAKFWGKDQEQLTGHLITTSGSWIGKTCISIPVHNEKIYTVCLDFVVSEEQDQVPFLKHNSEHNNS